MHIWFGEYGISAMTVAIDRCFAKNSKAKYVDKPIFINAFENDGLSEKEIYERELKKAILSEEQWIISGKQKRLPETII